MFTRKINYLWVINLILFIGVVFLGIQQAGRGADISKLENKLASISIQKRDLSENIFSSENDSKVINNASDSGFVKPSKIYYFNSIDTVASIK